MPRAWHRQGFPCCCAFHLPCVPTPLPRRKPAGAPVALFPASRRPSPIYRRVGFRISRFEACSAFTRVPARMVAEPPRAARLPRCFSPCRYLHEPPWLLPAGATVAGWDSHPPGKRAFPRRTVNHGLHVVKLTLHDGQASEAVQRVGRRGRGRGCRSGSRWPWRSGFGCECPRCGPLTVLVRLLIDAFRQGGAEDDGVDDSPEATPGHPILRRGV